MKKVRCLALVLLMVLSLFIPVLSSAESVEGHSVMWVNCSNGGPLNIRKEPSETSKVLKRLECGEKVKIIEDAGEGWAKIGFGKYDVGFVNTKYLVASKPGKFEITESWRDFEDVEPYTVQALACDLAGKKSVALRTKPNKTSAAIRRLKVGDQLQVIAVGKVWSKVEDPKTGKTGYVANDFISGT